MHIDKPIVVRLEGTNVKEGNAILETVKGLNITVENDLERAAAAAVRLAK